MRLDPVRSIFQRPGPFLSAYVDVTRNSESGAHHVQTRWEHVRTQLVEQGAPQSLVDHVGSRVLEPTGAAGDNARFVVATDDGVLVDDVVPGLPHDEHGTWSPLPDIGAWIVDRDLDLPVLVVLADHAGADLVLHRPGPGGGTEESQVDGTTEHLHKVRHPRVGGRFGGGAGPAEGEHLRGDLQRHTEEVWQHNARLVAAEVDRRADEAPLIVLAGDPRACADVRHALGTAARQRLVEVDHGQRSTGSSEAGLEHDVRRVARDAAVAGRVRLVHEYDERTGRGGGVTSGVGDTLAAAVQGQVETLLLDPDTAARTRVRPDDIDGLTLPEPVDPAAELRADQVAVAAAARTGADVCVAGPHVLPSDGVAALLRWIG